MRTRFMLAALALSASVAAIAPVQAQTTVNFDQSTTSASYASSGLVLNGFTITNNTFGGAVIIPTQPNYASVNGTGSSISFVDALGRATTSNGFSLTTVGLNAGGGYYDGATLTFLGTNGNILGTQTFAPVGPNEGISPITYSNTFANIASINFSLTPNAAGGGIFGLDSVTFTPNAVVSAVPETASWAMMIVGMGAVGFAMRRSRRAATRVTYAA